ncbi:MAG: tRNA glutamyl-Q(34) synthetase GluQRS [Alphaproteobacteria bacterium]
MSPEQKTITRFAPSPTGYLHLGHAYSALFAWRLASAEGGEFILRLEDIDKTRCRGEYEDAIFEDLAWLGITWAQPVWRQSTRLDHYRSALDRLKSAGLLYPCFCTRKAIQAELHAASQAPHLAAGPEGPVYPGTCRKLDAAERQRRLDAGQPHALRLDVARAIQQLTAPLVWHDSIRGDFLARPEIFGDAILGRKDIGTSYHLAVTIDDAAQGITKVSRAEDLLSATHIHRLLQALLDLPVPQWVHHPMITDADGARLAKRTNAPTLRALREQGMTPEQVRALADRSAANSQPVLL